MLRMLIYLILLLICVVFSFLCIIDPERYRVFMEKHPEWDKNGKWSEASDDEIRVYCAALIVIILIVTFIILKLWGVV